MTKTDIDQDDIRLEKASKYLIYMERKISRLISQKRYLEAWKHFDLMLRKSKVFAIFILNKVDKDWFYTRSYDNLKKIMTKFNRHVRLKEHMLPIHRTYIPKKTPGKVRPLGAPSIESRLVMAALTEFINIYAETYVGNYQYGFLPKRSPYQLGIEITKRLSEGKRFYEFDLDSFFNRVDYRRVLSELPFGSLSRWIMNINTFSIPKPKPLEKYDSMIELDSRGWHRTDMEYKSFGDRAYKQGFTQGANYSPVLSVIALEMAGFGSMPGLLMGADDGLLEINSSLESNIEKLKNAEYGIHLAEDKYFGPCQEKFKFFGWEFDTLKQTVTSGEETLTYASILKDADYNKGDYCKKFFGKSKKYSGKIDYKCGMIHTNKNLWQNHSKFKSLLVNEWNWTVHEESMLSLAPTCNFTLPSAKRIFTSIITCDDKSNEGKGKHGEPRFTDPQYYDLNSIGNWCNIRLLDMLETLSTWKCAHVKEKYYVGNPLIEQPGISFNTDSNVNVLVKPYKKNEVDYSDEGLVGTIPYEKTLEKIYSNQLLTSIKKDSLLFKQINMVLKDDLEHGRVSGTNFDIPEWKIHDTDTLEIEMELTENISRFIDNIIEEKSIDIDKFMSEYREWQKNQK